MALCTTCFSGVTNSLRPNAAKIQRMRKSKQFEKRVMISTHWIRARVSFLSRDIVYNVSSLYGETRPALAAFWWPILHITRPSIIGERGNDILMHVCVYHE